MLELACFLIVSGLFFMECLESRRQAREAKKWFDKYSACLTEFTEHVKKQREELEGME